MLMLSFILTEICAELSHFAAVGFLILAVSDLIVDLIYFVRKGWRSLAIYSRFPKMFADRLPTPLRPGWLAVLVPAWDESAVIAPMLRAALQRFDHSDYKILVGYYRNDPGTRAAMLSVDDPRVIAVEVNADGPTPRPIASTIC
jgi:adsorption protein B